MGCGIEKVVGAQIIDGDTVMIGGSTFKRIDGPRLPRPRCKRCGASQNYTQPFCPHCGKRFDGDEKET